MDNFLIKLGRYIITVAVLFAGMLVGRSLLDRQVPATATEIEFSSAKPSSEISFTGVLLVVLKSNGTVEAHVLGKGTHCISVEELVVKVMDSEAYKQLVCE